MNKSTPPNATSFHKVSLWQTIFNRNMLICLFTGFASGLPLYIILQLIPAWFQSEGVNIKTISAFALTQLPYVWKFVWSPFLDRFSLLPIMGRRRSWMFITQIGLLCCVAALGFFNPTLNIRLLALLALLIAFFSATQDIALDAFRREILSEKELGLGNSIHINAYRIAGLVPGSLSLILASYLPWQTVFIITALFMLPAILMTLWVTEPPVEFAAPKTLSKMIIEPFKEFFQRNGIQSGLLILAFIFFYKLGDSMATSLATPFYMQMGYSKIEIGLVAKNANLWPSVVGAILGGIIMIKIGINKALWLFGMIQALSILGFVWLAQMGPFTAITVIHTIYLAIVISVEALGIGLGNAAFVAFIAKTTNPLYTATQFALFTSFATIPRTLINAATGVMVEQVGWVNFFWLCLLLTLPGLLLLLKIAPWEKTT